MIGEDAVKAYVLRDIGKFGVEEAKLPVPGQDEVIVQVKAAGICGSDIPRIYHHGTYSYPLIPGHEFSGIVVKAGSAAEGVHERTDSADAGGSSCGGQAASWIGKKVGVFPLIPCGECPPCRQKKYEMCRHYSYLGSRRDGGFAEYVSVPVWNLIELPEKVTFEQAAMMEPMAVAVHAMRKVLQDNPMHTAKSNQNIRIAICGLGTVGLFLLMFLKEAGYEDILVIGNKDIQKEKAIALGISGERFYDSRNGGADAWLEQCGQEKAIDVFFECVGVNETVNLAVSHTSPGGSVMLIGNPASDMILERQTYWKILRNQLTLFGTWNSSYKKPFGGKASDDWQYVLNRLAAGRVHPEQMITHRYGFDGLMEGFEMMRKKTEEYLKVMLQCIWVFLICCMVSGCTAGEGTPPEEFPEGSLSGMEGMEDAFVEDTAGEAGTETEETWPYFEEPAWSTQTILNTGEEPEIMYRAEGNASIVSAAGSKDTAYAVISDYCAEEGRFYSLIAIDRKAADGEGERFPVREIDRFTDKDNYYLGYYQDTLYLLYSVYDTRESEWRYAVCAYESGEDGAVRRIENDLTAALTELLAQEYRFFGDFYDAMISLNTYGRILMWKHGGSKVYAFDEKGNACGEYAVDSSINYIQATDGRYLIGKSGIETIAYYVYDLENEDNGSVIKGSIDISEIGDRLYFLTLRNGSIYYCRMKKETVCLDRYDFYRYDIDTGEEALLFETEYIPGQPFPVINGVEDFSVRGDHCYFLNYDDGSLWWFCCPLSGEEHTAARLGLVKEYRGIFDVGEVVYDHNEYACEICGALIYGYHVESVQLSAEAIPCADQINASLREIMDANVQGAEMALLEIMDSLDPQEQEDRCENRHFGDRDWMRLNYSGVTQYTFERTGEEEQRLYLEADFDGYLDGGGIHGMPFKRTYLFDLNDGLVVSVGDIFGISEEEFCTLAAEYTVEDYQRNSERYFQGEDYIREFVGEHVDFHFLMHLSEEGVVIEYAPYVLGPYSSGFIPVTIPYEELGARLVGIYGVNQRE